MKIFVVNLDRSTDRRRLMERQLIGHKLDFEFFAAIDGRTCAPAAVTRYDETAAQRRFGIALSPGEIGCYASHYALWQHCQESQTSMMVIEDDVVLAANFRNAAIVAEGLLPECGYIRLAGVYSRPWKPIRDVHEGLTLVRFLRGPHGTQCYCLTPSVAGRLLAAGAVWQEPVDLMMDRFWAHGVACLGLMPFAASGMGSEFSTTVAGKQRRTGFTNRLRREVYRMAEQAGRHSYNMRHWRGTNMT